MALQPTKVPITPGARQYRAILFICTSPKESFFQLLQDAFLGRLKMADCKALQSQTALSVSRADEE
jgi:hypothetical protein